MPKFMVHDRWSNTLFLHWRVPPELEPILQSDCGAFALDRTDDGSAWIGLVLLTEQNVGFPYFRSFLPSITHHGANVRTYVKGTTRTTTNEEVPGIHFSSLECDDILTACGANVFGMPYKFAKMSRSFFYSNNVKRTDLTTTRDNDRTACRATDLLSLQKYHFSSRRLHKEQSLPMAMLGIVYRSLFLQLGRLHSTRLQPLLEEEKANPNMRKEIVEEKCQQTFGIKCEWETKRNHGSTCKKTDEKLVNFLVERYHVYTQAYGLQWRGQVSHAPWKVVDDTVQLTKLELTGIDAYEPNGMRPLIRYMNTHSPDSVLFSAGVGPIAFEMLRPID